MSFCPNPECPQFKKTGKSSEFMDGTVVCSDCGGQLSEKELAAERAKKVEGDLKKRLIFTLGMLALWRVLSHIAPPGVNVETLSSFLGDSVSDTISGHFGLSHITVFTLGLIPYITAYVCVEIFALVLKPLKSWRESGYSGRLKLRRTALIATLILALAQGYGIASRLAGMHVGNLLYSNGIGYRLFFALTLTTGTFIAIWIADQITRKGIGHGISVLICSSSVAGIFLETLQFTLGRSFPGSPFEYLFIAALLSGAMVVLITFMEKGARKKYTDGMESYIPLKLTTAGIIPADWAGYLLSLPFAAIGFMQTESYNGFAKWLSPGELGHSIIYTLLIFFLYYIFTSTFNMPRHIIDSLKLKGGSLEVPVNENAENYIDRVLEVMAFPGAIYLCLLYFLPEILIRFDFPIFLGGVVFIITVAILLDLFAEFSLRKKAGQLIKVGEFQDIQKAGLLKAILEQKGIPCLLQGYYHRSLLYFFGPYIEISVLVPKEKSDEALELVEQYIP